MFIPTGVRYTAHAWGSAVKTVTCRHCGTEFVYELRRLVAGESSAPGFIGMKGAKNRAGVEAHATLLKTLARDHDLIACPHCGRLQPEMNWILRKRWLTWIAVVWVFTLIAAFGGYMEATLRHQQPAWTFWLPVVATALAIWSMVWACNKEFRAAVTDRAQLKEEAEAQGYARLGMPRVTKDGWIWTRATLFVSPEVCAECGAPPTHILRRDLGEFEVEARVCKACHRRAFWWRVMWGVISFVAPVVVTFFIFWNAPRWDLEDALVAAILLGGTCGGFVLAIVYFWYLGRVAMPIKFRKYRDRQDSVELKFKSDAAAELFLAAAIARMQAAAEVTQTVDVPALKSVVE